MDALKDIRWRQRFENYQKSYHLIEKYAQHHLENELERAGLIQLFEVTFELAWKVLKDYLEAEGYNVKSPRETIKTAFQAGIIEEGHIWIDALSSRNLTTHTYDEATAEKLVQDIGEIYFPELRKLYEKLSKE
ncbi:nucleotidyltransferase substrate binding protein [Alicyclobacillus fodiniaquatilis]|jgi:nucleotidyltransferase substrate binding protein (TIGR01987 family)|uniref:Nucleotidyltransferase substrate binding protein n=1 Tax=Alicyclobacillus fodiniaquatilis TaxID=1661150 RepID=A0ABW4JPA0_9BACL